MSDNNNGKNYVGSGWEKIFPDGGTIINIMVDLKKLQTLPLNDYGSVKLTVGKLKNVGSKGQTHYVCEDQYGKTQASPKKQEQEPEPPTVNMPF